MGTFEKTVTIAAMRDLLVEKATVNEAFRATLLADTKNAIEDELGLEIPDGFNIQVHEEAEEVAHLVLPPSVNLNEDDLELVAAGHDFWSPK